MGFDSCIRPLKIQESIETLTPKMGVHLKVRVHSLTLFCTPTSIRCDPQASLLACNLASPCLGHEPKARVGTRYLGTTRILLHLTLMKVHIRSFAYKSDVESPMPPIMMCSWARSPVSTRFHN